MDEMPVRATVRLTQRADAAVVDAVAREERYRLVAALRMRVPGLRISHGGIVVKGHEAGRLQDPIDGLQLEWSEDARRFVENRARALPAHGRIRGEVEAIKAEGVVRARGRLSDLDDSEVLDDHQLVNIAAMVVPGGPGLCVFDEQGAGKTVTLIFAHDLLVKRQEADALLVVAPKSMVSEWPRDFARFKQDLYRVATLSGRRRDKLAALRRGADVFVMNFETVVSLEAELVAFARARDGRTVLTVDESFYVKNLDTRRTQAVRRLREWCGRTYVLCGTPAPNSAHDLVQQMDLVDFGGTFGGVEVPDARGAANIVVQRALADRGLYVRHLKRDVLPGLPGKSFESVLVPLQPQQLGLYEEAQRTLIRDLQDTDNASFQFQITSFLARRLALLQICSHPGALARGYTEIPAKLLALDAILEELIERRAEKVVVWSYFRYSLERIVGRYARYGAVRYDGSVSSVDERRDVVRRFQEDASTRLFVGNPAAAGAGLTLHRARIAVYESMSDQAAQYLQSLDRIHRRGQDRQVEYILLLADGTIEGHEYGRLLEKQGRAEALLGDRAEPPPTRERMLGELGVRAAR